MKILQVTNKVPYPAKDGGAIACLNLSKGFSQLGHQVTILSMNTKKHHVNMEDIPDTVTSIADIRLVKVPARITVLQALFNLIFSKKPYNAVRFISDRFRKSLEKLLDEKEFDVIQLEGLYLCPYIPVIRNKTNALIAYRSHNIEYEIWKRTMQISSGVKRFYLKNLSKRIFRFEKAMLNRYDVLVPITSRDERILIDMGNTKPSHVSQTGIDSSVLIPYAKHLEHPTLFHLGSMEWAPNQEGLIWFVDKCWPAIHEKYPKLKFYVAGRNAPQWLQKKMDRPNIEFIGEVENAYEFMNSKSVMIVPLFSGSGMRIKIIEGMALGKSIVTTPIGAEGINVVHRKHLLIANNESDFVHSVFNLIDDPDLFRETGKNAIEFIHENFDNLATAGKLIDFYQQFTQ